MTDKILNLAKKLIEVPSVRDNPDALKKVLEVVRQEVRGYGMEEFSKNGVSSLLFYNTAKRPDKFKVILNAHVDVVPAKDKQYHPYESGGKLFGRGAYDMKAAAAAEILVFNELAKNLPFSLGLQIVTDEEIGGANGTKYQIEKGVKSEFVIAGEPTDFSVNNKAKGIVWARITSRGTAAHGAYLWQGENAILKLKKILDRIEKEYPVPAKEVWKTTVNLSRVETANKTFNKVPDEATASFDIRYIPEEKDTIVKKLKDIAGKDGEVDIVEKEPPHIVDEKNKFVQLLRQATKITISRLPPVISKHGASDLRHYSGMGVPGVIIGPVGFGLHTDREWVEIKSLGQYSEILKRFLQSL